MINKPVLLVMMVSLVAAGWLSGWVSRGVVDGMYTLPEAPTPQHVVGYVDPQAIATHLERMKTGADPRPPDDGVWMSWAVPSRGYRDGESHWYLLPDSRALRKLAVQMVSEAAEENYEQRAWMLKFMSGRPLSAQAREASTSSAEKWRIVVSAGDSIVVVGDITRAAWESLQ